MSIHEIGYVYDCDLDMNWVLRMLIEPFRLIECDLRRLLGRWCKEGAWLCICIYCGCVMRLIEDVYAVLMPRWIEIICLNQKADYVRLEYTKTNVVYWL